MKIYDIHTHGIGGYDTRASSPEDILEVARMHGERGVQGIVLSVYPGPLEEMRADMEAIGEAMALQGREEAGMSRILGVHLEGPFLSPERAGALDRNFFQRGSPEVLYKLTEGYEDLVRIMTVAPEIEGGLGVIEAASTMGIVVMMGHSDASFEEAENGFRAGARGITHIFNAMGPFHHRAPGLAGFGLLHPEAYIEVIGDPWHLHPATLRMIFRVKGLERIIIVSDTVKESGLIRGAVKSGAGRLMGGAFSVTESVEYLESLGFDRDDLIRMVSENPARLLDLKRRGQG